MCHRFTLTWCSAYRWPHPSLFPILRASCGIFLGISGGPCEIQWFPNSYCGFYGNKNNSEISLIFKDRVYFVQTCQVRPVQFSDVEFWLSYSYFLSLQALEECMRRLQHTTGTKKSHVPDVIYFLLTAWQYPSGVTAMWVSPALITAASQPAPCTWLCSEHRVCLALLSAAFWTCLLLAFSLLAVSHCAMDAACRWSRKCLLSPSMHWLSARCIGQPDLQQPPCSLNPPFPGRVSQQQWLSPSHPSVPFVHEHKILHQNPFSLQQDLVQLTAQWPGTASDNSTDTKPHLPNSAGSVEGSADFYPPLMVSPRWPLSHVLSQEWGFLSAPACHTTGMVCRLVLACGFCPRAFLPRAAADACLFGVCMEWPGRCSHLLTHCLLLFLLGLYLHMLAWFSTSPSHLGLCLASWFLEERVDTCLERGQERTGGGAFMEQLEKNSV